MSKVAQLSHTLRQLIEQDVWQAGQKLPSLREQAQTSGYSLMTVLNAYQELEAQGLIYAKEKSGFYVEENISETKLDHSQTTSLQNHIEINPLVFQYLKSTQRPNIVPFGSAFPNEALLYCPKLLHIVAQYARQRKNYSHLDSMPPGLFSLQQSIARRYSLQGIPSEAQDIVITSGCLDALNLSLQAIAQNGDYILLQKTMFYGAWQAAERLGLKVITLPEHPEYGFDLAQFEHCLKTYPIKVCWLMLNSHNPIGFTVSDEIKQKIAELLDKYQVHLIEDDVYQELYYGTQKPRSVKAFDTQDWVLHCCSFSKVLGAGFRIGWVHNKKLSSTIQYLQMMSTLSVSPLLQHALVEFLASHHYEKHLKQLRQALERHKKQFYLYLKQYLPQDCEVYYYPTSYFLWIKLPKYMNSMQLYQDLLHEHISIAPSQLFTIPETPQNYIRLNCSFEITPHIQQALEQIIKYILYQSTK